MLIINTKMEGNELKIYDYKGKKNLSGRWIREARNKKKITQTALAARVQLEGLLLERDSISRIEIGTRFVTDYELKIFAKILEVDVKWLISEED